MRIGPDIPDLQVVSTTRLGVPSAAANKARQISPDETDGGLEDKLSISALTTQALQTPEIRQGQVDNLERIVSEGEYRLDPGQIASAMLNY